MVQQSMDQKQSGKTWAAWLVPMVVVGAAAAGVIGLAMVPTPQQQVPPAEPPPVNVTTLAVRAAPAVPDTFDLPGTIEPNRVVRVAAEVAGQIASYGRRAEPVQWQGRVLAEGEPIDEGEPVREGAVLVELDRAILEAERDRAQAQYDYDLSEYERIQGLQQRGATTAKELKEAATRAAISRAVLKAAQEQLDRAVIRSPIRGVLNRLPQEVGEYVKPGDEVAQIVDVDPIKVVVYVPERDVGYLAVGQEVQVLLEADTTLIGRISYISALAEQQTRSSRVEVTLPNPDQSLRSGQIVRVRLTRRVLPNAILIPLEAVIPLEQGYEVYVVEEGVAQPRRVTLGPIRQDRVVVEGLREGEQLVVAGQRFVSSGQPVNVVRSLEPEMPAAASQPANGRAAG